MEIGLLTHSQLGAGVGQVERLVGAVEPVAVKVQSRQVLLEQQAAAPAPRDGHAHARAHPRPRRNGCCSRNRAPIVVGKIIVIN